MAQKSLPDAIADGFAWPTPAGQLICWVNEASGRSIEFEVDNVPLRVFEIVTGQNLRRPYDFAAGDRRVIGDIERATRIADERARDRGIRQRTRLDSHSVPGVEQLWLIQDI